MIDRIDIKNFKSIALACMSLGRVYVFIGANGSDKLNIFEAKLFIKILFSLTISLFSMGTCSATANTIKVITFNIGGDFIANGPNQWKNRKPMMMRFLSKEAPDILCVQEALYNQLNDLQMSLQMYEMVGVGRVDGKKKGDFNSIYYRKDKFEQINSGTFCLSEKPDSIGRLGWDAKYPRIATWINLRYVETGDIVFILNTHLDNVGKKARVEGIKLILEKIALLSKSDNILLTGDFNDVEKSKVHALATQWGLVDTYLASPKKKGVEYSFHEFGQKEMKKRYKLDYVFTSKCFEILSVNIPKERLKKGAYISDHNPVIVKMKF